VWLFHAAPKLYKDDPPAARRMALRRRFDRIFTRATGFVELDEPGPTPTRTSCCLSSTGPTSRCTPTARRPAVSPQPPDSRRGPFRPRQAGARYLSLLKTCSKLAISFWDYLGARLKIPDTDI